jgi:hypothetical protein
VAIARRQPGLGAIHHSDVEPQDKFAHSRGPSGEERQYPALKTSLQSPHPRPAQCDGPTTQRQLPLFAVAAPVGRRAIHCPPSLRFLTPK